MIFYISYFNFCVHVAFAYALYCCDFTTFIRSLHQLFCFYFREITYSCIYHRGSTVRPFVLLSRPFCRRIWLSTSGRRAASRIWLQRASKTGAAQRNETCYGTCSVFTLRYINRSIFNGTYVYVLFIDILNAL